MEPRTHFGDLVYADTASSKQRIIDSSVVLPYADADEMAATGIASRASSFLPNQLGLLSAGMTSRASSVQPSHLDLVSAGVASRASSVQPNQLGLLSAGVTSRASSVQPDQLRIRHQAATSRIEAEPGSVLQSSQRQLTASVRGQDEGIELNGRRRDGRSLSWMEYSTNDEVDTVLQHLEDIGKGPWHLSSENQTNSTRLHRGDSKAGVLRNHPERHQLLSKPMSNRVSSVEEHVKENLAALQPMLRRWNNWCDTREESYPDDTDHYVSCARRKNIGE